MHSDDGTGREPLRPTGRHAKPVPSPRTPADDGAHPPHGASRPSLQEPGWAGRVTASDSARHPDPSGDLDGPAAEYAAMLRGGPFWDAVWQVARRLHPQLREPPPRPAISGAPPAPDPVTGARIELGPYGLEVDLSIPLAGRPLRRSTAGPHSASVTTWPPRPDTGADASETAPGARPPTAKDQRPGSSRDGRRLVAEPGGHATPSDVLVAGAGNGAARSQSTTEPTDDSNAAWSRRERYTADRAPTDGVQPDGADSTGRRADADHGGADTEWSVMARPAEESEESEESGEAVEAAEAEETGEAAEMQRPAEEPAAEVPSAVVGARTVCLLIESPDTDAAAGDWQGVRHGTGSAAAPAAPPRRAPAGPVGRPSVPLERFGVAAGDEVAGVVLVADLTESQVRWLDARALWETGCARVATALGDPRRPAVQAWAQRVLTGLRHLVVIDPRLRLGVCVTADAAGKFSSPLGFTVPEPSVAAAASGDPESTAPAEIRFFGPRSAAPH